MRVLLLLLFGSAREQIQALVHVKIFSTTELYHLSLTFETESPCATVDTVQAGHKRPTPPESWDCSLFPFHQQTQAFPRRVCNWVRYLARGQPLNSCPLSVYTVTANVKLHSFQLWMCKWFTQLKSSAWVTTTGNQTYILFVLNGEYSLLECPHLYF